MSSTTRYYTYRSDTLRIEYAMRNGQRKLEMMRDPRVSGMGRFNLLKLIPCESQIVNKRFVDEKKK